MSVRLIKNPQITHPLADTDLISIEMEWDEKTRSWVTYVPELNDLSDFGHTYEEALDNTAEGIIAYLETTLELGLRLPIPRSKANKLLRLLRR